MTFLSRLVPRSRSVVEAPYAPLPQERRQRITFDQHMQMLRQGLVEPPDPARTLNRLHSDLQRHQFCLAMAEYYRTMWYRGRDEQVERIVFPRTKSDRIRYASFGSRDRRIIGVMLWAKSPQARNLADQEQMFDRWSKQYASSQRRRIGEPRAGMGQAS